MINKFIAIFSIITISVSKGYAERHNKVVHLNRMADKTYKEKNYGIDVNHVKDPNNPVYVESQCSRSSPDRFTDLYLVTLCGDRLTADQYIYYINHVEGKNMLPIWASRNHTGEYSGIQHKLKQGKVKGMRGVVTLDIDIPKWARELYTNKDKKDD